MVLNNVSQFKHIQLTKYALLHTKNIPRVLYNTVEFYHFENI